MTVNESKPMNQVAASEPSVTDPPSSGIGRVGLIFLLLLAAGLAVVIYRGIASRAKAETAVAHDTEENAIPTVTVTTPDAAAPTQEIVLPGNTQAFTDTPIYARTNGYIRKWYFDIGARVKAGQLLAEIETPEVDQQLQQAKADLATAQANYELAKSTAERWQDLLKTDSVSKQETDEKVGDFLARKANVESAQSNVRRLQELQGFQKLYAPFSGVITARNVDIGTLITAGSNTAAGRELFHLANIHTLRVYVSVPEIYSRAAVPGAPAALTLDEFPGRTFNGKLVRHSNAIDSASHTLLVEVDVDNPRGELLPGAYAMVHLKLPTQVRSVTIPSNALLFRQEGLRAVVVRDGKAELVPITAGRDFGKEVEIVSGLTANDTVVLNPPDSLISGTPVHVRRQSAGNAKQQSAGATKK